MFIKHRTSKPCLESHTAKGGGQKEHQSIKFREYSLLQAGGWQYGQEGWGLGRPCTEDKDSRCLGTFPIYIWRRRDRMKEKGERGEGTTQEKEEKLQSKKYFKHRDPVHKINEQKDPEYNTYLCYIQRTHIFNSILTYLALSFLLILVATH